MDLLTLEYDPSLWMPNPGGQAGFLDDFTARHCALAGGWYSGKTWAGARKSTSLHVHDAWNHDTQAPTYVKGLVVCQNFSLARTQVIPELEAAFDDSNLSYRFVSDPKRYCFELHDFGTVRRPSEILVRSAEAPEAITSFTVGWAWGDEAGRWPENQDDPKRDPFIQMLGRVRDPRAKVQQINYTFTHEGDNTRVFRDFEEEPKPDHRLYRVNTEENPTARDFADEVKKQFSGTPELAKQYLGGQAARLRGNSVYSAFETARNVDASLAVVKGQALQLAIDFNINPGMHAVVGQHLAASDTLTALHVIHGTGMDVRGLIAEFRRLLDREYGGWVFSELDVFGDASGGSRWAGTGETCWDIVKASLQAAGIPYRMRVPAANPLIADRINAFNCALSGMDGRVRYKAHPRCELLIRDLKLMKWDKGEVDKRDRKLSHPSDAEGYRVWMLMPIRRPSVVGARGFSVPGLIR